MNILIQSIIGISLAPITLYILSTLYEKVTELLTTIHCGLIGAKDFVKSIKYNLYYSCTLKVKRGIKC